MFKRRLHGPHLVALATVLLAASSPALCGFSVDEDPREVQADPGDVFFPGLVCDMDDGDGSCPEPPSLSLPEPEFFDMDALSINLPLLVCPPDPPFIPGILFSFDDGDPGPGVGPPNRATEIFLYDHCQFLHPIRRSYYTGITESSLGLANNPPPLDEDDDVDAYDTRAAAESYEQGVAILFSPDTPSDGGLGTGSEGSVWSVDLAGPSPVLWADPRDLGVPDLENCDIDGIARIMEPETTWVLLFTTDAEAPCGLDPGDIYVSGLAGTHDLFADDVNDLKIASTEDQEVDIDALAINDSRGTDPGQPFFPPDFTFYKAEWPNYAPSGMPDFSQDHAQWDPTLCGPTAMANSLWWFDSEMACDRDRTVGSNAESEPNDTCDLANLLGEVPPIPGDMITDPSIDWYMFAIPDRPYRHCTATISTCAMRGPGDVDTLLSLYGACDGGVAGGLIAVNDNGCLPNLQSEIIVDLEAGRRYWVSVEELPSPSMGTYTISLGLDCYPLVQRYPDAPDDHSEYNPVQLIPDLAWCMNTDDVQGMGSGHTGTRVIDMDICIDQWLFTAGLEDRYTKNMVITPPFEEVAAEVERSEDVLLLLGFWWQSQGGEWLRCGGHWVTASGVDTALRTLTISDPALNNAETGAAGQVLGPDHSDHAPAGSPPPDHDDTRNLSHDRYQVGASMVPWVSLWSLPQYATDALPTTCGDVARWCMWDSAWGQNPAEPPQPTEPCTDPDFPVSTEVEWMADVSPVQTPLCVFLDSSAAWPDSLRVRKGACNPAVEMLEWDMIRGKLCNLRFSVLGPMVELGHVQCLYDDVNFTEFDELSPDDTGCMGSWFYLVRQSGDSHYGQAGPNMEIRIPDSGGCP